MDKLRNILSPGHQHDNEILYSSGKPKDSAKDKVSRTGTGSPPHATENISAPAVTNSGPELSGTHPGQQQQPETQQGNNVQNENTPLSSKTVSQPSHEYSKTAQDHSQTQNIDPATKSSQPQQRVTDTSNSSSQKDNVQTNDPSSSFVGVGTLPHKQSEKSDQKTPSTSDNNASTAGVQPNITQNSSIVAGQTSDSGNARALNSSVSQQAQPSAAQSTGLSSHNPASTSTWDSNVSTPIRDLPGAYPDSLAPTPFEEKNEQSSGFQSASYPQPTARRQEPQGETATEKPSTTASAIPTALGAAGLAGAGYAAHEHNKQSAEPTSQQAGQSSAPTTGFPASNKLRPDLQEDAASTASIKSGVVGREPHSVATSPNTAQGISTNDQPNVNLGTAHRQQPQRLPSETGYLNDTTTFTARSFPLGGSHAEHSSTHPSNTSDTTKSDNNHGRNAAIAGTGAAAAAAGAAYAGSHHRNETQPSSTAQQESLHTTGQPQISSLPASDKLDLTHTGAAQQSKLSGHSEKSDDNHYGRNAALAGAGAAVAGAAYAGTRNRDADTGPASHTVGPHSNNFANIADPTVHPQPEKQKSHDVKHPETGPATHTLGPHSSNTANIVDPRVQPNPQEMKGYGTRDTDTGPASKTIGPHKSNLANILDPRVQPDPAKQKGHTTTGPHQSDPTKAQQNQSSSEHHYGRDAAVVGGAGLAGAGAAEAWKKHRDEPAHDVENHSAPYSNKALDPRVDDVPSQSPSTSRTLEGGQGSHFGSHRTQPHDNELRQHDNKAAPIGAAALGATSHHGTTPGDKNIGPHGLEPGERVQPYDNQRANPTSTTRVGHPVEPEKLKEENSHAARNVGLAAGAAGLAGAGYAAHEHNKPRTEPASQYPIQSSDTHQGTNRPTTQQTQPQSEKDNSHSDDRLAAGAVGAVGASGAAAAYEHHKQEAERAEKEMKERQKAQEKQAKEAHKQHEKDVKEHAKAEKKLEHERSKEAHKLEKRHQKEMLAAEKDREAELKKLEEEDETEHKKKHGLFGFLHRDKDKHVDEKAHSDEEDKHRQEKEIAADAGVAGAAAAAYGAHEHENKEEAEKAATSPSHDDEPESPRRRSGRFGSIFHRKDKERSSLDKERASSEQVRPQDNAPATHPAAQTAIAHEPLEDRSASGSPDGSPSGKHGRNRLHKNPPKGYHDKQDQHDFSTGIEGQTAGVGESKAGQGIVTEPVTGLPMNVGEHGDGQGGTDANETIHGYRPRE